MEQHLQYTSRSLPLQESNYEEYSIAHTNETVADINERLNQYNELYKNLYLPVYYFAKTFVNPQEAEDITADSFLKLWRSNLDFIILPKVKAWLNVCTKNACIDLLMDKKKEAKIRQDFTYTTIIEESGTYETDIREALLERLDSEIDKLPPQCKKVFKMSYLERLTAKEIAINLGISENTVSNHRAKGLRLLRFALKSYTYLHLVVISMLSCIFAHHW